MRFTLPPKHIYSEYKYLADSHRLSDGLKKSFEAFRRGKNAKKDLVRDIMKETNWVRSTGPTYEELSVYLNYYLWPKKGYVFRVGGFVSSQSKEDKFFLYLLTLHRSGYVRQKALSTIEEAAPNAFWFSAIIYRCNDWVPQVRSEALKTLQRISQQSTKEVLFAVMLEMHGFMVRAGRLTSEEREVMQSCFSRKDFVEYCVSQCVSRTSGSLKTIFSQCLSTTHADKFLLDVARRAVSPAVRALAFETILRERAKYVVGERISLVGMCKDKFVREVLYEERKFELQEDKSEVLALAVKDRSIYCRRVAAQYLTEDLELAARHPEVLDVLSKDPYPSVQERVAYIRKKLAERG